MFCPRELQIAWPGAGFGERAFFPLLGRGSSGPRTPRHVWVLGPRTPLGPGRASVSPCALSSVPSVHSHLLSVAPSSHSSPQSCSCPRLSRHPPPRPLLLPSPASLPCPCLPCFLLSHWPFPPLHTPPCPLPRVFLSPFPGTVKAPIVPCALTSPSVVESGWHFCSGFGLGTQWEACRGGWAFWAHVGLRQEPEEGRGSGAGGEDACAQTRGPLRLGGSPGASQRPPSLPAAGRPRGPAHLSSDGRFLWGLRGVCSCLAQASRRPPRPCLRTLDVRVS